MLNKDIQNSGKHCSCCNAPQKGYWIHGYEWEFIVVAMEHHITCSDISAPVYDHMDWDNVALYGSEQPIIPRPFGPYRDGSRNCKSGSIASGGSRDYCTCSVCF